MCIESLSKRQQFVSTKQFFIQLWKFLKFIFELKGGVRTGIHPVLIKIKIKISNIKGDFPNQPLYQQCMPIGFMSMNRRSAPDTRTYPPITTGGFSLALIHIANSWYPSALKSLYLLSADLPKYKPCDKHQRGQPIYPTLKYHFH